MYSKTNPTPPLCTYFVNAYVTYIYILIFSNDPMFSEHHQIGPPYFTNGQSKKYFAKIMKKFIALVQ